MPITVVPNESAVDTVLRSFLTSILPASVEVVAGQANRVAEPSGNDFVVVTWLRRRRIETNWHDYADVFFTGAIAGGTLTVTALSLGTIGVGATLFGSGVITGTYVTGLVSGAGGTGTYAVTPSQVAPSEPIAAGSNNVQQNTEITYQVDVYGPNAHDNAEIITTLYRDQYAYDYMTALNPGVAPLHADDPVQTPFISGEAQFQNRWMITALLQANQVVEVPQQFASAVTVVPKEVEAFFPP